MVSTLPADDWYIRQTLKLAKKAAGWTNPNPMVGAIIVKKGKIIGQGHHHRVGLPHAEIEALHSAKESVKGSTLYVNLEPCSHYGRTPPCVDALLTSGINKVVCSTLDPNPHVHGKGVTALRKAGIDVSVGLLEKETRSLNEAFFTFHEKKRPFVAIKFAASLDGAIATKTGDSKWITSEKARRVARTLRSNYQAVLVGIHTVLQDNPHLGSQTKRGKDPLRIIIDPLLKIPFAAHVLRDTNVLIMTTARANDKKRRLLEEKGMQMSIFQGGLIRIDDLLSDLYKRNIISVFVEGGGETIGHFVDALLVDRVYAFYEPIVIGGTTSIHAVGGQGVATIAKSLRFTAPTITRIGTTFLATAATLIQ